jgi:hypothetical protein
VSAVASAFLPWATVGPFTINGTEGDGQITLVLSVILAVLGAIRLNAKDGKAISWMAAGVPGAIGLIGAQNRTTMNVNESADHAEDFEEHFGQSSPFRASPRGRPSGQSVSVRPSGVLTMGWRWQVQDLAVSRGTG